MSDVYGPKEFDPSVQRRERLSEYDEEYKHREMGDHLAKSSAAQLAISLAGAKYGFSTQLLEERLQGKEISLDDDLSRFLTDDELKFLPAATYIVEGLHQIDRIEGGKAWRSTKIAVESERYSMDRMP